MRSTSEYLSRVFCRFIGVLLPAIFLFVESHTSCTSAATQVEDDDVLQRVQRASARQVIPLAEGWEVQAKGTNEWHEIDIQDSWEKVLGVDFDGIATYRIRLPEFPPAQGRVFLRFHAIATDATVFLDGVELGQHLGGWTPFQVDLTDRNASLRMLTVRVDERVGHNTQGFLPVFIPHFGGIWKPAEIILTPARITFDDLRLYAAGWSDGDSIEISAPLFAPGNRRRDIHVGARIVGNHSEELNSSPDDKPQVDERNRAWTWSSANSLDDSESEWPIDSTNRIFLRPKHVRRWSPEDPHRYRIELVIQDRESGELLEQMEVRAAIRHVAVNGAQIQLNGKPIQVRGVLNWGYAPPRFAPTLSEEFMRRELVRIKAAGFNLMKFCLWIPPRRYLELCDEMGVLAWVEYPTWHPKLTGEYLRELEGEYDEFFAYDRNHPAIILRSLTCETGPSAELEVIQRLYDQAHASIPYCIVEDDSSWIGWNRVHDFYDDHPYGNNHTWRSTLQRLKKYIAERQLKPLMLGEAIAADTWTNLEASESTRREDPRWQSHALDSLNRQEEYLQDLRQMMGDKATARLRSDSLTTALRMRKFQIETYRQQVPGQGYVVSVIRDFPFAAMGLIDFRDNFKWSYDAWNWHGETILKLSTPNDRRSCYGQEPFRFSIDAIGDTISSIELQLQWQDEDRAFYSNAIPLTAISSDQETEPFDAALGTSSGILSLEFPRVDRPRAAWLAVTSRDTQHDVSNRWAIWVVPKGPRDAAGNYKRTWSVHSSIDPASADCPDVVQRLPRWNEEFDTASNAVVTRWLDKPLLDWMAAGGRVLLISKGSVGAPPVSEHWFLRGGVIVSEGKLLEKNDADLISQLQTFDLAAPVMLSPDYLRQTTPIALLWDNHDQDDYRTHALAWMSQVGAGRLLCSSLETSPQRGPATQYVCELFMKLLEDDDQAIQALSAENQARLYEDILDVRIELPRDGWQFQPDPESVGEAEEWYSVAFQRDSWNPIQIGLPWDSQGFADLDGFGWYAREVALPKTARFLTFTGVDDSFDLWIDGTYVGKGGDRESRTDTFSRFVTLPIPAASHDQKRILIVVRVDDWQGAGGIFRPVFVSKTPLKNQSPILRRKQASTERP